MEKQTDWLGNELVVGDPVLYSSTSVRTGMNLGELVSISPKRIQVKVPIKRWKTVDGEFELVPGTQVVTLQKSTSAFRSVTKYFGPPQ
jgi:hypothetical protein